LQRQEPSIKEQFNLRFHLWLCSLHSGHDRFKTPFEADWAKVLILGEATFLIAQDWSQKALRGFQTYGAPNASVCSENSISCCAPRG